MTCESDEDLLGPGDTEDRVRWFSDVIQQPWQHRLTMCNS